MGFVNDLLQSRLSYGFRTYLKIRPLWNASMIASFSAYAVNKILICCGYALIACSRSCVPAVTGIFLIR